MSTPAGWYSSPENDGRQRYWDGAQWTDHYSPAPRAARAGAPAGWYVAPGDETQFRYWDGAKWTDHYAPKSDGVHKDQTPPSALEVAEPPNAPTEPGAKSLPFIGGKSRAAARRKLGRGSREELTVADLMTRLRLEPARHPLNEQTEVAGETYHIKGVRRIYAERGLPITSRGTTIEDAQCTLVPEPWNPHDSDAVAVVVGAHQVGYLPADLAGHYSEPLGRLASQGLLATGEARLWAKDDAGVVRARVTILIPEAVAFR